jgi:hypothetical protein
LTAGLHTIFVEISGCGIRSVCEFLKLVGLDRFVASSFEAQRKYNVTVEKAIVAHGTQEQERLSKTMPKKDITVAQDETFTGGLTLVALEPVSNYILLEKVAEARDTATWKARMDQAMKGLNCNIIQSTSDEAPALIAYAESVLGAQHSPDLFHVQQEMTRAVSAPISAKLRSANRIVEEAKEGVAAVIKSSEEYAANLADRGAGRPPNWSMKLLEAQGVLAEAEKEAQRLTAVKESMSLEIKGMGLHYHLADLKTGQRVAGSVMNLKLQNHIDSLRTLAANEGLSDHSMERINKAERVLPKMAETIDFVSSYINREVDKLGLTDQQTYQVHAKLIPAAYLSRVAAKMNTTDAAPLKALSAKLLGEGFKVEGVLDRLTPEVKTSLSEACDRLATIFQRSSSCVEGRNGVLSLRHHGLRGLSERKRQCLTVLHNFFIKRADESTAAGRFFGTEPRSLFEAVLASVEMPRRPKSPPRLKVVEG